MIGLHNGKLEIIVVANIYKWVSKHIQSRSLLCLTIIAEEEEVQKAEESDRDDKVSHVRVRVSAPSDLCGGERNKRLGFKRLLYWMSCTRFGVWKLECLFCSKTCNSGYWQKIKCFLKQKFLTIKILVIFLSQVILKIKNYDYCY